MVDADPVNQGNEATGYPIYGKKKRLESKVPQIDHRGEDEVELKGVEGVEQKLKIHLLGNLSS